MFILNTCSLMKSIGVDQTQEEDDEDLEMGQTPQNPQAPGEDEVSDDEKDAKYIKSYMARKRRQGLRNRKGQNSKVSAANLGEEIYEAMIKKTLLEIRDMTDREERQHNGKSADTPYTAMPQSSMKVSRKEKIQKQKEE